MRLATTRRRPWTAGAARFSPVAFALAATIALGAPPFAVAQKPADNGEEDIGQRADPNFRTKVEAPAYASEHPQVLIDEAHHNYHTASGRYKVFADLISSDGYHVEPSTEAFTKERLDKCAVLVIANATGSPDPSKPAFTEAECQAVREWVEGGGALLLITDHQPFGAAAASLARQFGVDMSKGVTEDPQNVGKRGLLFSRAAGQLGPHPIMEGRNPAERINRVLTFTGQSLKGPADSVALLKFSDTAVDHIGRQVVPAAGRAQGVALTKGKGRVVVLGEAAQLSAQVVGDPPIPMGMNVPGADNRQMALNIMHWLSGLTD